MISYKKLSYIKEKLVEREWGKEEGKEQNIEVVVISQTSIRNCIIDDVLIYKMYRLVAPDLINLLKLVEVPEAFTIQ